ncbi:Glutamyl-tRNA(Gln) amidotransferase subunit A [compost metagenome]
MRAPAALNGLVGYKPSTGVISLAGCLPLSDTLDVLGSISRNVADARLLTQLLAGPDIDDAATLAFPANAVAALRQPARRGAGPLAVLVPEAWPAPLADAGRQVWELAQENLAQAGFTPTPWCPPAALSFARMADDNSLVLAYEAYRHYGALAEDPAQPLWEVVCARIAAGGRIAQADYEAALLRRAADMAAFAQAMQGVDALLMPACDQAAQTLDAGDARHAGLGKLLRPANFLGAAAISLPAGFDAEGMPIGVQLLAPAGGDAALLDCASALEPVLAPAPRRPDLSAWGL